MPLKNYRKFITPASAWINPRDWVTGEPVHADLLNQAGQSAELIDYQASVKPSDSSKSSSTSFSELTGLKISIPAGTTWTWALYLNMYTASSTPDLKLAMCARSSVFSVYWGTTAFGRWGLISDADPITRGTSNVYSDPANISTSDDCRVNLNQYTQVHASGYVTATVDLDIVPFYAQNTSDANAITAYKGSLFEAWRIA